MAPRAKRRQQEIAIINKSTGQVLDFVFKPAEGMGGRWVRVFQDAKLSLLLQHPELRGQSLRVLHYLEAVVAWGNLVPCTASVAGALGLHQSHVSRAYAELTRAGFLIKEGSAYYLNPLFCWKGSEAQLGEAVDRLLGAPVPAGVRELPGAYRHA